MSISQMYKRSQVSNEFIILLGMSVMILLVFLSTISDDIRDISYQKEYGSVRDIGFFAQHEIMVAADVKDGYIRSFILPDKINGHEYTITNTQKHISVVSDNKGIEQVFLIPDVFGNFAKGQNIIEKRGGVIYLN